MDSITDFDNNDLNITKIQKSHYFLLVLLRIIVINFINIDK